MRRGGQRPKLDAQLWVIVRGFDGKGYILGNPHTHHGRMKAWFDSAGTAANFSKAELVDCSELARVWIDGFLAGSEPSPEEMFGEGIHDADEDDPRWRRWRDATRVYRQTGYWDQAPWHEVMPFPSDTPLPEMVWTLRGDEVWIGMARHGPSPSLNRPAKARC